MSLQQCTVLAFSDWSGGALVAVTHIKSTCSSFAIPRHCKCLLEHEGMSALLTVGKLMAEVTRGGITEAKVHTFHASSEYSSFLMGMSCGVKASV